MRGTRARPSGDLGRLRIGVSGHRILAEEARIEAGVRDAVQSFRDVLRPESTTIVSGLAEGSDRLVARCVLGWPGADLLAVLPLPQSQYEADFQGPRSRREFTDLLARARAIVELPPTPERDRAYEAAGVAVLDRSDALVAVWDGQCAQGLGGTGAIVELARRRRMPIAWVHAGNRVPGTLQPTSLGAEQGRVTFENFTVPLRIRVAVVGERGEIARQTGPLYPAVEAALLRLLDGPAQELIARARHTPLAYTLMSALDSEGEQALVADWILQPGSRLDVVLPLSTTEHRRSLESEAAMTAFDRLVKLGRHPVVLRAQASLEGSDLTAAEIRRETYRDLGEYLVENSDLVIVVRHSGVAAFGGHDVDEVLTYARSRHRPIVQVTMAERVDATTEGGSGLEASPITWLELFNTWPIALKEQRQYTANQYRGIFDRPEAAAISADVKELVRDTLIPFYVRASKIAKHYQRRYKLAGFSVYTFSVVAVAAVAIAVLNPSLSLPAFTSEFILLVVILLLVWLAHRQRTHRRWIESRFLAERLRSACFLAACGLEPPRLTLPGLRGIAEPAEWTIRAFDDIWGRLPAMPGCHGVQCAPIGTFAKAAWIDDQIGFHQRKHDSSQRQNKWLEGLGLALFALAILASAGHIWLGLRETEHVAESVTQKFLSFLGIALPAGGAAAGGFRAHREFSRLAKRSHNMAAALQSLSDRFSRVRTPEDLEGLLEEAEDVTRAETQDWLALVGAKQIEPL
ncbi:MAG: hypothetical protein HYX76_15090 [Acidobacteria bacterium]|nr:hypothetical protein [Acidobacteriota bacterium]